MLQKYSSLAFLVVLSIGMTACSTNKTKTNTTVQSKTTVKQKVAPIVYEKRTPKAKTYRKSINNNSFANKLSNAALGRLRSRVRYDGSYVKIAYPWGDVPPSIGVCTDVVIRSYRKLGIDLQQQVHQDMSRAFASYPNPRKWGLSKPDTNIDHRRVYNLRQFFARRGAALPITRNPRDYKPGDLVTWMVGPDLPHIGVVVNRRTKADPNRYMIVHNIARGPEIEDILFRFPISGHYRYTPAHMGKTSQRTYITSKRRGKSRQNGMSYSELLQAASILGSTPKRPQSKAPLKSNNKPLQVANLSNIELQKLLSK